MTKLEDQLDALAFQCLREAITTYHRGAREIPGVQGTTVAYDVWDAALVRAHEINEKVRRIGRTEEDA